MVLLINEPDRGRLRCPLPHRDRHWHTKTSIARRLDALSLSAAVLDSYAIRYMGHGWGLEM